MSISRSKLNSGSTFYGPSHVPPEHIDYVCICDVQPCALSGTSCQQTRERSCQGVHEACSLSAAETRSCGSSSSSCCFLLKTKLSSVLDVTGLNATFAPFASGNRNSAPACLWHVALTAGPAAAAAAAAPPFPECSAAV